MNLLSSARIMKHIFQYRLHWNERDTHYRYQIPGSPQFMGPRDAVRLIKDKDTVIVCGIGGNQRISILSWALKEVFEETHHPQNLTLITAAGLGGRGKVPGTLEEWAVTGLVSEVICSHFETYRAIMKLAEKGELAVHCIPLGVMAALVKAGVEGKQSVSTTTGVGTFCDPRVDCGSEVFIPKHYAAKVGNRFSKGLITVEGDKLRYQMPKIDVAMINAPAADAEGNIYIENCSTICESKEAALAAKRNGGKVIVNIGKLIEKKPDQIFLTADQVDAIVYYPETEQTCSRRHDDPMMCLTDHFEGDIESGLETVRLMNKLGGITPKRSKSQMCIAEECADLMQQHVAAKSYVNIGIGLPELICDTLQKKGLLSNYTLFTEGGVIGGVPAPGMFFGAAVKPEKITSSPAVFELANDRLEATVLGFLQIDSKGNVNASKRGEGALNYVGPGGFIDLSCAAKTIFFVGAWMAKGEVTTSKGVTKIKKHGTPKFVDSVEQITFSGQQALKADQNVFYITDVGTFKLTKEGMMLIKIRDGINLQKDILDYSPMKIILPH
ncbi:hypothetical protein HWV00_12095 [Moritella sp. 24]|uniref:CoA-transferase n=1 Tax=Moritella sp. 24 TaxID=2746230 RepID=UPI001BA611EE|nr:CoA-transferase [Moritella sp. 24]QUM76920.1 hypothetical protein HWV00_12095 [Moritella sp. 24]